MEILAVTAAEAPIAAKVFAGLCGLGFLVFGAVLVRRSLQVSAFAERLVTSTGSEAQHFPGPRQVRGFGIVLLIVGALLVGMSVMLLL
ncbi:hypothetical protein ACIF9R_27180 [Streptomyces sp. NPDC086080]|uniref:hypothetical protein n=1 Tax=Streptomyces sp. NPDC086080 TaxID=3365748 RepID=UPI0037D3C40A